MQASQIQFTSKLRADEMKAGLFHVLPKPGDSGPVHADCFDFLTLLANQESGYSMGISTGNVDTGSILVHQIQFVNQLFVFKKIRNSVHRHSRYGFIESGLTKFNQFIGRYGIFRL